MFWQNYALANSNALDGLNSTSHLVSVRTWYDNVIAGLQIGFGILTILCTVAYVISDKRKKNEPKGKSVGFFMTILSAIVTVMGLVAYIMNTRTDYFINLGVNYVVVACAVAAIVLQVVHIVWRQPWSDVLAVLSPVLLIVATITLFSTRINGSAAIMTFQNTAQNMADLTGAIVAIAVFFIAVVIGVIASFFRHREGVSD